MTAEDCAAIADGFAASCGLPPDAGPVDRLILIAGRETARMIADAIRSADAHDSERVKRAACGNETAGGRVPSNAGAERER